MFLLETMNYERKILMPGVKDLWKNCWSRKSHKTMHSIVIALGCLPELIKTLLLETTHTLIIVHREIKPELSWKISPCWLAFIVPRDARQVSKEEKSPVIYLVESCKLQWWHPRKDMLSSTIVAWLLKGQPTTFWLDLRLAPQEGTHARLCKPS